MFSPKSRGNLLSLKDNCKNDFHILYMDEMNLEHQSITKNVYEKTCMIDRFPTLSYGLYWTRISATETYSIVYQNTAIL